MRKFVLDTNIYIMVARDSDFGAELVQFAGSYYHRCTFMRGETCRGWSAAFIHERRTLAAPCRETGMTIITLDEGDFRRIASVEEVDFEVPWPLPES